MRLIKWSLPEASVRRVGQRVLALIAVLYLVRGYADAVEFGLSFPLFLTVGVGLVLVPASLLSGRRRWVWRALVVVAPLAVVVNSTMLVALWHGMGLAAGLTLTIIGLWLALCGLIMLPATRSAYHQRNE